MEIHALIRYQGCNTADILDSTDRLTWKRDPKIEQQRRWENKPVGEGVAKIKGRECPVEAIHADERLKKEWGKNVVKSTQLSFLH